MKKTLNRGEKFELLVKQVENLSMAIRLNQMLLQKLGQQLGRRRHRNRRSRSSAFLSVRAIRRGYHGIERSLDLRSPRSLFLNDLRWPVHFVQPANAVGTSCAEPHMMGQD